MEEKSFRVGDYVKFTDGSIGKTIKYDHSTDYFYAKKCDGSEKVFSPKNQNIEKANGIEVAYFKARKNCFPDRA